MRVLATYCGVVTADSQCWVASFPLVLRLVLVCMLALTVLVLKRVIPETLGEISGGPIAGDGVRRDTALRLPAKQVKAAVDGA